VRTALKALLIIIAILVVFTVVATMTPVGWSVARSFIEQAVVSGNGLDLTIGSLRGNLFNHATLKDVTLTDPEIGVILSLDELALEYSLPALLGSRILAPDIRIADARVLVEMGEDGRPGGWSRFVGGEVREGETGLGWGICAHVAASNLSGRVISEAEGYDVDLRGIDIDARVDIDARATADAQVYECFDVALAGSANVVFPTMLSPVEAFLSCVVSGDRSSATAEIALESSAIAIEARGGVRACDGSFDAVDVESSADLEALAAVFGWGDMSGEARVTGSIEGPFKSPVWEGKLVSGGAVAGGVEIGRLDSSFRGEGRSIELEKVLASALGGEIEATAVLTMRDQSSGGLWMDARVEATGIDLSSVGKLLASQTMEGTACVDARLSMNPGDLASISGSFDGTVIGLGMADNDFGDVDLSGAACDGEFTLWGSCCDAQLTAAGDLSAGGVSSADLTIEVPDLASMATGFGISDVMGAASAVVRLDGLNDTLRYTGSIDLRGIETPSFVVGDGLTVFSGGRTRAEAGFSALDGTLVGDASVEFGEGYRVTCRFDSTSLAADIIAGSVGLLDVSAQVTGGVVITGNLAVTGDDGAGDDGAGAGGAGDDGVGYDARADGGTARRAAYVVDGNVEALRLSVSGESIELAHPMRFVARPDSLFITETQFAGDFGRVSLGGVFDTKGESSLSAGLDSLNIAAALRLAPEGALLPDARGLATGRVVIEGRADDLHAAADLRMEDLIVEGLALGSVELDAETDSHDLLFDVEARSPFGGKITANGSFPCVTGPGGPVELDPSREFAATAVCSSYALEGGVAFIPALRGRKKLRVDGSMLLVGRADSVSSFNGAGRFDELSATLDVITFSLVDTFEFTVADGDLDLHDLDVEITRMRALGEEAGGRIDVSGGIGSNGQIRLAARTFGLKIGHVARAFLPGMHSPVLGDLDLITLITGSIGDPNVEFAWELSDPLIFGFGFDGFGGNASLTRDCAHVGRAELTAGDETIALGGNVPLGRRDARLRDGGVRLKNGGVQLRNGDVQLRNGDVQPGGEGVPSGLDVWIAADGFDLNAIDPLPGEMRRLRGDLGVDVRLTGTVESPLLAGSLVVSECEVNGYGLKRPLHDIELRLAAADGMTVLERAFIGLGDGSVTGTGFIATGVSDVPHFMIDLGISGAEIDIDKTMKGRFGGNLRWVGTTQVSTLSGNVEVEKMEVTRQVEFSRLVARKPRRVSMASADDPRRSVHLDVDLAISDPMRVRSDQVHTELTGGLHVGGSVLAPMLSGGVSAPGGTFRYLRNTFSIERLDLVYSDPRRRDPYLGLTGSTTVKSRSGVSYEVTVSFDGFLSGTMPALTSSPSLSEPDIMALLTMGDTIGVMAGGGSTGDSASDSFSSLARSAFVGSLFGIAESTVERWLHLDTVAVDREALDEGDLAGAGLTLGKRFGGDFRIDYTTELGQFAGQSVSATFRLSDSMSLVTRASQEGNHAVGLKFHLRFQ
jgi:hypothetical protein